MGNQTIKALLVVAIVTITSMAGGCYYDNEEYLYGACDTTAVTYSLYIAPIMSGSCNSCHTGAGASGGVITSTYNDLKIVAASGQLRGAVNHASGFSPMPPTGIKLGSCELNRINAWINQGMPE